MFDYLGVLISIIFGLALTHLLLGCARMIQMRRSVRVYWVQIVWTVNVVGYVLGLWWGMFWWKRLQVWTIEEFFFLTGYSIVVFMLASMLFPADFREELDFEEYFYGNKSWFFGTLLLVLALDIPETLMKGVSHLRDVPVEYMIFIPIVLAIAVAGFVSRNRRLHAALSVAWLVVFTCYMTFTSLDRIVAG